MFNRLVNKYKRLSPAVKASLWFMICSVLQKGISFFTVPIYTRVLTTEEYGLFNVYSSWVTIVYIFATLNMHAGVFNNGMIKYECERDKFVSSLQGLTSVICIIVYVILLTFNQIVYRYSGMGIFLLLLMLFQNFFTAPYLYWIARQRFSYKYVNVVIVTLIIAIFTPILSIVLILYMQERRYGMIISTVTVQTVVGLVLYVINWKKGHSFFDGEIWKYCFWFNLPLIPHYLSYVILGQADRIMIDRYCGSSFTGIYSLAYQISLLINLITNAIDGSYNPWTFQKLKYKDYLRIKRVSTSLILLFGVGVLTLVLIAPEIMKILAPPEYYQAIWVVPPVIGGCFYLFIAGSFIRVEFYHEKNTTVMLVSVFTALLNIILNAIFIPIYGFIAAAYTTLVSYMVFCVLHYFIMRLTCKYFEYSLIPFDGNMIALISVITIVLSGMFMAFYNTIIVRYIILFSITVICFFFRKKIVKIIEAIKG